MGGPLSAQLLIKQGFETRVRPGLPSWESKTQVVNLFLKLYPPLFLIKQPLTNKNMGKFQFQDQVKKCFAKDMCPLVWTTIQTTLSIKAQTSQPSWTPWLISLRRCFTWPWASRKNLLWWILYPTEHLFLKPSGQGTVWLSPPPRRKYLLQNSEASLCLLVSPGGQQALHSQTAWAILPHTAAFLLSHWLVVQE